MLPKASSLTGCVKAFVGLALIAAFPASGAEHEIAVVGPIDAINCKAQSVTVLGVRFAAGAAASRAFCELGTYSLSTYVSAVGKVALDGSVQLRKLNGISNELYVPGASLVYIRGEISNSDRATGTLSLSGALIDGQSISPNIGSVLEIVGTQPLPNGLVLPISLRDVSELELNSSVGSGVELMSSVGSGAAKNSSVGSGVALFSSVGSGAAKNSSVGSGVALLSSVGSGAAKNSSVGSGVALMSSVGSGAAKNSSVGSGAALLSSVGSGTEVKSSVGSGTEVKSSVGSGSEVKSSVGSGTEVKSSVGSGTEVKSSVGSGTEVKSSVGSGLE